MEWWIALLIIFGGLIVLMAAGVPTAFCFFLVNIIGVYLFWGGEIGLRQLILSVRESVQNFALLPVPLFILMGEVIFHSGVAPMMMDALDKWLGRVPGRLGLLAVGGGTLFATLTGSSLGTVAMLGSVLVPEMEKRGYKKSMSLGPILGSAGLSIMIPPTSLGVLLAALARISIGGLLVAIVIPGLLMAFLYAAYIILRCYLQPSIAPIYDVPPPPLSERIMAVIKYVMPVSVIIFLVLGLIFLGVATPTESAAMGALGTFILAAAYGKLNWLVLKKSLYGSIQITVMIFMIIAGATAFSQLLAFTGASTGMVNLLVSFPLPPILIIVIMQLILLILGAFMDSLSMVMITLPIYIPIVKSLGFDLTWFAAIMLLNMEMATTTPPFGLNLFILKGVVSTDTAMADIYKAGMPFLLCDAVVMALMLAFPAVVLWLPGVMK